MWGERVMRAIQQLERSTSVISSLGEVLVAISLVVGLVGCGGNGSSTGGQNPVPSITTISPKSAAAGQLAFTLDVNGSDFLPSSTVQWSGSSRSTTVVSSSHLQAQITAADLAAAGKMAVTVVNPAPGGGNSNSVFFTVAAATITFQSTRAFDGSDATDAPNSTPNIWAMNPDGSGATPLTQVTALNAGSVGPAPLSPDGSKVVFASRRALDGSDSAGSTYNVWVVNADGTNPTPLTKLTAGAFQPAWSPDGSKIVFASSGALDGSNAGNSSSNIWVMNADGSSALPLTKMTNSGADSLQPAWSPDGSKIVFGSLRALDGSDAANANNTENIWVMNADGSGSIPLTKLTAANANCYRPAWSPDSRKIAYTSTRAVDGSDAANPPNLTQNIWVVNADGSSPIAVTRLTAAYADSAGPAPWSPDGTKIVFTSRRALDGSDASDTTNSNVTDNIWVVNPDGSGATPITTFTGNATASSFSPVWWPGGSKFNFVSSRALDGSNNGNTNGTRNIWVMNADGSGVTALTKLTAAGADSLWPQQP